MPRRDNNAQATQQFAIKNIMVEYTNVRMTPDAIDALCDRINRMMTQGPDAWAFKQGYKS